MTLDQAAAIYKEAFEEYADSHNPMHGRPAHLYALLAVLRSVDEESKSNAKACAAKGDEEVMP